MYSPGSLHTSTTLPDSTIIMHWPLLTAILEPLEIILSSPPVLELRLWELVRFCPFIIRMLAGMLSQ